MAEEDDLKSFQCRFESDQGHSIFIDANLRLAADAF